MRKHVISVLRFLLARIDPQTAPVVNLPPIKPVPVWPKPPRNEHLSALMEERGHSVESLAEKAGHSPRFIRACLNGYIPGMRARRRLAEALGVGVAEVWPGPMGDGR